MKRVLGDIKSIIVIISVVICIVLCNKVATYVFSVDGYSCVFDSKISNYHQNEIFDFINETKDFKSASLRFVLQKITDYFSVIKSAQMFQLPSGILQVKLQALDPQFLVNGVFIVAENGSLFDKRLFSQAFVEKCHALTIQGLDNSHTGTLIKKNISESCKKMIFRLPQKSFQEYYIVRESETKSYMTDKLQEHFIILFNDKNVPDEQIVSVCAKLKNELEACGAFLKKRNKTWFADVRFKDQIVLCNERRRR